MDVDTSDVVAPASNLLPGLIQRPPELGRIRMGEKSERGFPVRLKTFRLTSHSRALLDAAAVLYGGEVRAWTDAPDEGMWELVTERSELDVLIPATLGVISQSYELWQGGTCERRCDGTTEQISGQDCLCAKDGLEGPDRLCDIMTRLRVMLPRVPGLGVWRLDTSGYVAATTLPSTVQLLARLTPGAWIPAVLRAEQRSKKERLEQGKVETHRFVVPVIDLPGTTIGEIVGGNRSDAPMLEDGERRKPPTAAERAAARRAELEAANQQGGVSQPPAAAVGNAAPPAATADLPLPRGACPVSSPRSEACRLPIGHDGDHKSGLKSWPTPNKAPTAAGKPPKGQERARSGPLPDEPAEVEQAAGVVTAPAANLPAAAREVFGDDIVEGEFTEAVEQKPAVVAGEHDTAVQEGMRLLGDHR